jgi:hypothetical protein
LEQAKKDPKWSWELFTGKLTIRDTSWTLGSGEVKLGEANVYKIIAGLFAAPIAACVAFNQIDERAKCVREVLDYFGFAPRETKPEDLPIEVESPTESERGSGGMKIEE